MSHLTIPPHSAKIVRKNCSQRLPVDQARATGVPSGGHAEWKTLDIYPGNVSRITKQLAKQLDGIELVRLRRETRDQKLCFSSRPFVLCGLPFRALRKTQLLYEGRNGHFVLQIAGHPDYGVPFGQDRLVPIFLATLAIQQKSPMIRFKTAAEMLDIFGMSKGGREYRRLIAAFERIFGATIFFGTDTLTARSTVVKRTRFNFFSEAQIWYHGTKEGRSISEGEFENVIVLSTEFYEEVIAHPIPTDFEVVRILSSAPAILDLFVWLSYRCFTARGKESIPIFGNFGLVQQLGTTEYTRPRRFRQKLDQWLRTIRLLWPECDGLYLVINHATAVWSREQSAHI